MFPAAIPQARANTVTAATGHWAVSFLKYYLNLNLLTTTLQLQRLV